MQRRGRGGGPRPDRTRRTTPSTPSEQNCSTDQNAPRPFYLCASPQLSARNSLGFGRTVPIHAKEREKQWTLVGEAGERKEHQPTLTLTKEGKAGPASTPVSPGSPVKWVWRSFYTRETVEKNINKKGKCPNPPALF